MAFIPGTYINIVKVVYRRHISRPAVLKYFWLPWDAKKQSTEPQKLEIPI